jgi:hypothetical protein
MLDIKICHASNVTGLGNRLRLNPLELIMIVVLIASYRHASHLCNTLTYVALLNSITTLDHCANMYLLALLCFLFLWKISQFIYFEYSFIRLMLIWAMSYTARKVVYSGQKSTQVVHSFLYNLTIGVEAIWQDFRHRKSTLMQFSLFLWHDLLTSNFTNSFGMQVASV